MWPDFLICVAIGLIVVFLPGALVCKALRQSLIKSVSYAPLVSVGVYAGCGTLYPFIGVTSSWTTTFLPLTFLGAIALTASALLSQRKHARSKQTEVHWGTRKEWLIFTGYILFGVLFTSYIFVKCLNGADAFSDEVDNLFHYGRIREFLASGNWSSLDSGFYPSAMHVIAALMGNVFNAEVVVLSNATLTLFIAFVFPAGMHAFMKHIFPTRTRPVVFGMLTSFCFAAFPWRLLGYGPTTPFLLSLCVLPALCSIAMEVLSCNQKISTRVCSLPICCFGIVSGMLMQTSVLFTFLLVMFPFAISQVANCSEGKLSAAPRNAKLGLIACIVVVFVCLWIVAFKAPFMQGVIDFPWAPVATSVWDGLSQAVLFGQQALSEQLTLALLTWIGFFASLMKPKLRWIAFPYLFMTFAYFVVATFDAPLEKLIAGFWYTDPIRMAANQCFFAIPLASLALGNISKLSTKHLQKIFSRSRLLIVVVNASIGLVLLLCVFAPYHYVPGKGIQPAAFGLGGVRDGLTWEYSTSDDRNYSRSKSTFSRKVVELIGNEKVLNNPIDGSGNAWGIDGVNVVFSGPNDVYDYTIDNNIAGRLSDYTTSSEIQQTVEKLGAQYVMQLDSEKYAQAYDEWNTIDLITEDTPGFKLILREGDMSLYKIEDLG